MNSSGTDGLLQDTGRDNISLTQLKGRPPTRILTAVAWADRLTDACI